MKQLSVSLLALFVVASLSFAHVDTAMLAPPPEPIPATLFGMHIHHAADGTPWPAVPVGSWRLWDARVSWPQLEPRQGQWRFELLDRYLSLAKEHNAEVLLPLGLSPQWASARPSERSAYQPGFAAEPEQMDYWRDYVTAVVTHCKGRVQAYEIWNEPNNKGFWTGDVSQLLLLTREAATIIHQVDPNAYVVSPAATTSSGVEWLRDFLNQGGGRYVDVIAYHFYVAPQPPEAMVPLIQQVKEVMTSNGAGTKPLWNTEAGWAQPKPFPSDEVAAAYLARAYILNWAAGVERFYWYAWDNHSWVSLQTTDHDSQIPTPAGRAYGVVQSWLVGARMKGCTKDPNETWTCELTRENVPEWIVWNAASSTAFHVPQQWHTKSVMPLLGEPGTFNGSTLQIGPTPQLLAGELP